MFPHPQGTNVGTVPLTQMANRAAPMHSAPTSKVDETRSCALPPRPKPGTREKLNLTARDNLTLRDKFAQKEEGRANRYLAFYHARSGEPEATHPCQSCKQAPGTRMHGKITETRSSAPDAAQPRNCRSLFTGQMAPAGICQTGRNDQPATSVALSTAQSWRAGTAAPQIQTDCYVGHATTVATKD